MTEDSEDRYFDVSHKCSVVTYDTSKKPCIWRCVCGQAFTLTPAHGHVRAPQLDSEPSDGPPDG